MKVMICSAHHWHSPIQVSAHQYAREFVRHGWDVVFLSTPVTPFHLAAVPRSKEHRSRFAAWWHRGQTDLGGRLRHYTPQTVMPLSSAVVGLRWEWILRRWQDATVPSLARFLRKEVQPGLDVLIVDTALYAYLFDELEAGCKAYRVTDYNPGFDSATRLMTAIEREAVQKADVTLYTAAQLKSYVESLGATRSALVPHGVDLSHFRSAQPPPEEYGRISEPRAIYVGSLREWFDYDLVNALARRRQDVSFVIIGPEAQNRQRFADLTNLHVLGPRPYSEIPRYLQHAQVGLIPFAVNTHADLVAHVNPLKLYEYMACGLPVVSSDWEALRFLETPALLCIGEDDFDRALGRALVDGGGLAEDSRRYAESADWSDRFDELTQALQV